MPFYLEYIGNCKDIPPRIDLKEGANFVGREQETSLPNFTTLNSTKQDLMVSRKHARIEVRKSSAVIEDLTSTNGTQVRGLRIEPCRGVCLEDGNVVTFGGARCAKYNQSPGEKDKKSKYVFIFRSTPASEVPASDEPPATRKRPRDDPSDDDECAGTQMYVPPVLATG